MVFWIYRNRKLSHFGFEDNPVNNLAFFITTYNFLDHPVIDLVVGFWYLLNSVHPQTAHSRDFSVGRRDLNPQNSTLFLWFKSDARLELTQNPSFVNRHCVEGKQMINQRKKGVCNG